MEVVSFEYGTPASLSPAKIKEMLIEFAIPMPNYQAHEVGAGFMSQAIISECFGDVPLKIMDLKII